MATLDERGLTVDGLPELLAKVRGGLQTSLSSLVPVGQSLTLDDSSVIMRILAPLVEIALNQEEALQEVYSSLDLDQATGVKLEKLVAFGGVSRLSPTPAEALLMLYGETGVVVPALSKVGSNVTGDVFRTQSSVEFSATSANGVELSFPLVGTAHTVEFIWAVDNDPNTNVPVYLEVTAGQTTSQISTALAAAINVTTVRLRASVTNAGLCKVVVVDQNDTAVFSTTNADALFAYKPVRSLMVATGEAKNDRNTINTIQSGLLGWLGVTNPFASTDGTFEETDALLRDRFRRVKGVDGDSSLNAMTNALLAVSGVKYMNIKQNKLSVDAGGVPAHGIGVVVLGGDEDLIGQAIFNNLPIGINTGGDETTYPVDINGNANEIKFSRPSFVPIKVDMTLVLDPTFPDSGAAQIKQALIDYFTTLKVGEDIRYSRLFSPINTVGGFGVSTLQVGKVGGSFSTGSIVIDYNELATISANDITFGGGV